MDFFQIKEQALLDVRNRDSPQERETPPEATDPNQADAG